MTDVTRKVTHTEAKEIAHRLIRGSFRRDGERLEGDDRPRFSIPCRPDHDDDTLILAYIEQREQEVSYDHPVVRALERERIIDVIYDLTPANGHGWDSEAIFEFSEKIVKAILEEEDNARS